MLGLCSLPFSLLGGPFLSPVQCQPILRANLPGSSLTALVAYNDRSSLLALKPYRSFYHLCDGQSHLALFGGHFSSLGREAEKERTFIWKLGC